MAVLIGSKGTDSLATMRYNTFSKKVDSASSFVTPERLPQPNLLPNCIIVEHTTRSWAGKDEGMDPRNWGWILQDNRLVPPMSTMNVAPDNMLKSIHFNCSTVCKTLRCSCRSQGMGYHVQLSVDRPKLKM